MRTFSTIAALFALQALCAAADLPALEDRGEDLASLAAYMREKAPDTGERYKKALEASKGNRPQLELAVDLCATRREKLAMVWLISRMSNGNFARLEDREWTRVMDVETLPAELLRNNVLYALLARDLLPWCRELDWDLFLNFVLPYRHSLEKAEDFRPGLFEMLRPLVQGASGAEEALLAVNGWAAEKVKLVKREPQEQGVLETLAAGKGRQEDLVVFAAACAAAVGIPCASAHAPWLPNSDGSQTWNEAWIGGRWVSFEGCRPEKEGKRFDRRRESSVFAKVFRKRFAGFEGGDEMYGEDLTAGYTRTAEVALQNLRPDDGPVRLAVYNSGGWRVISAAKIGGDGKAGFKHVGCAEPLLYAAWLGGQEARLACPPFILNPDGSRDFLSVEELEPGGMGLKDFRLGALLPNTNVGVAYFNGQGWTMVARAVVDVSGKADFGKTGRENTLYVMVRVYGERLIPQGRPFTVKLGGEEAVLTKY